MTLLPVLLSLTPVGALIALGLVLKRTPGFRSEEFWSGCERLAYYCLLPVLLFSSVAEVDVSRIPVLRLLVSLVAPTLLVSIALVLLRRKVAQDIPSFTSVLQGGIRFNTYICLSISASLFGQQGSALAAIVAAILVPTVNIVSSLGFELLGSGPRSLLGLGKAVVANPLVLGCVLGGLWNLGNLPVPEILDSVLSPVAAAALPIGLLCVGAGLRKVSMADHAWAIVNSTVCKLLLLPALSLAAMLIIDVPLEAAMVGMIFQSMATASSGYVMARQLGGNSELMAALIAVQTVLMAATLPLVLVVSQAVL